MITITIDRERLSIEARGHAGAAKNPCGHDLVCCAISTLMMAYAHAGRRSGHMMEYDHDDGYFIVRVDPDTTASQGVRYIFEGYVMGLELVAENYPKHVQITHL